MAINHQGKILVASAVLAVGMLGYMAKTKIEQRAAIAPYVMPIKQGQNTLDELVKDPRLENFWDAVETVVYDPGFVKYEAELRRIAAEQPENADLTKSVNEALQELSAKRAGLSYATTLPEGKLFYAGKKSVIFVGEDFFEGVTRDDQISFLYHEERHAHMAKQGIPLKKGSWERLAHIFPGKKLPNEVYEGELQNAFVEAYAYGWQLHAAIKDKKFRLSPHTRLLVERNYVEHRAILKRVALEQTPRGTLAREMVESLPLTRND